MEVIIFEGPAGSGKSTHALEGPVGKGWIIYKPSKILPRDHEGPQLSLQRDYQQIVKLVLHREEGIVFDRFWYGSLVYDYIRGTSHLEVVQHTLDLITMIQYTKSHLSRGEHRVNPKIRLSFHFVLPTLEQLKHNRLVGEIEGAKTYPFDAEEELKAYNTVFLNLKQMHLPPNEIAIRISKWKG